MFSDEYLPRNRGFESTYGHLGGGIGYYDHALSGRLDWHRNGEILYEDGYSTTLIADEAIRIIENKKMKLPSFFMLLLMHHIHLFKQKRKLLIIYQT